MINGSKQFITNAGTDISGVVVITAVTGTGRGSDGRGGERTPGEREISNLIVAQRHPGLRAGRAVPEDGLERVGHPPADASPTAGCPRRTSLGQRGAGFRQFLHVLDIGRIGVAAMGVGLAQGALDQALAYAKERRAFGRPISKFQAIQSKLANMSTEIEATRLLVLQVRLPQGHRARTSR